MALKGTGIEPILDIVWAGVGAILKKCGGCVSAGSCLAHSGGMMTCMVDDGCVSEKVHSVSAHFGIMLLSDAVKLSGGNTMKACEQPLEP